MAAAGGLLRPAEQGRLQPFGPQAVGDSPPLRRELDYLAERGIPRSVGLGRQRTSRTRYIYDDDGRLVESVTTHDAEWTDDDIAHALAWADWRAGLCDGCGHPLAETINCPPGTWVVTEGVTCDACQAREDFVEAASRDDRKLPRSLRLLTEVDPTRKEVTRG